MHRRLGSQYKDTRAAEDVEAEVGQAHATHPPRPEAFQGRSAALDRTRVQCFPSLNGQTARRPKAASSLDFGLQSTRRAWRSRIASSTRSTRSWSLTRTRRWSP